MKAIKKAVNDMGSKFRQALATMRPAPMDEQLCVFKGMGYRRIPSSSPVSHSRVNMPADPGAKGLNEFPFQVHYEMASVRPDVRIDPSIDDPVLRSALRRAIQSRQGVFEWVRGGQEGLRQQLEQALHVNDSIVLGQGFVVHGLNGPQYHGDVCQWRLLVSAPAIDRPDEIDTFSVPLTEFQLPVRHVANADLLSRSELALQAHMFQVDCPYQDSVENPMILSIGCDELAGLHALQTEVSSRMQAGLISSQRALLNTVEELAPIFLEGKRLDSLSLIFPGLQQQLVASANLIPMSSQSVLARKRHFTTESRPSQFQPDACLQRELTLAGKAPACRPSESAAFRQIAGDNHCGIASVNSFFQAEVMNSAQAINHILDAYASAFGADNLADLNLPGLYHPNLIDAMQRDQSIVMSQEEFTGQAGGLANHADFEALFAESPADQWNGLCNYRFQGATAGNQPASLEVTPDLWLSAATGIHADSLESILNQFLQTKMSEPQWSSYPDQVERVAICDPGSRAQFEQQVQRTLNSRSRARSDRTQFPMIFMNQGHYFAVARADNGDWLKLDSNGTRTTGVQATQLFARRGELAQALSDHGVVHVICEPLRS